ncbi:MAG: DUF502 domain-containing protein [Thiomargarita sp.]|nr:DUF502 domain-containing protein [Thiomargarita sp.]
MIQKKSHKPRVFRYIITGILTVIPLWLTWIVFHFLFTQLSQIGTPAVHMLAKMFEESSPSLAQWIVTLDPLFLSIIAVIITLISFYLLGWMSTFVIGKRIIAFTESLLNRLPFVQTIYGSSKKLIAALQQKPGDTQRVVFIEFPSAPMKTVGFVTQTMIDEDTGQKLAAVYVPTTPNPTSGYLEIVPVDKIVSTDWTMEEAMTFIISGGAVAPERLNYTQSVNTENLENL